MPAYVLADIEVQDEPQFEEYKRCAPASIAAHGGRYLVRGGRLESLEGGWAPRRLVIIEFPSMEKAQAWWNSAAYSEAKVIRQAASRAKFLVAEGI